MVCFPRDLDVSILVLSDLVFCRVELLVLTGTTGEENNALAVGL